METLADRGEADLVALIAATFREATPLEVGIGDDGAVFAHSPRVIAVADAMVEGIHFDRRYCPAEAIGRKLVAVNVSDIAAMGGRPTVALFTAGLPGALPWAFVSDLVAGVGAAAAESGLTVVGGDVTGSPGPICLSLSVLGEPGPAVLMRSGARVGDGLYVTGGLGGSGFGLRVLCEALIPEERAADCIQRHLTPTARLAFGRALAFSSDVGACMDLSDGLAQDAPRLAAASHVGLRVDLDRLPIHPELRRERPDLAEALALHGGEDYELLFTSRSSPPIPATRIGEVVLGSGIEWRRDGRAVAVSSPLAYRHFGEAPER